MAAAVPKVSLKLFIDTKARKVLYAEADKNFVDFLFYIISMPVASVVKLVDRKSMVGFLGKFYGLKLLKAAISTQSVLTTVFLG